VRFTAGLSIFTLSFLTALAHGSDNITPAKRELNHVLGSENCVKNERNFVACAFAVNTLYENVLGETLAPITRTWAELRTVDRVREISVKLTPPLKVVRLELTPHSSENSPLRQKVVRKFYENAKASWLTVFPMKDSFSFTAHFEALLKNATWRELSEGEKEGLITQALTSYAIEYYQDGHARALSFAEIGLRLKENSAAQSAKEKGNTGIGITFIPEREGLRIVELTSFENREESALLQKDDWILKIDDHTPFEKGGTTRFSERLLGVPGTKVRLHLLRGSHFHDVTLTRRNYESGNVLFSSISLPDGMKKIGVIQIRSFEPLNTCSEVKNAVLELISNGSEAFVIDLRNNGGGEVSQASCIAGIFLRLNQVLYRTFSVNELQESRKKVGNPSLTDEFPTSPIPNWNTENLIMDSPSPFDRFRFTRNPIRKPKTSLLQNPFPLSEPVVILLNENSASASELLAGGLRDHDRALIVGEKSFGKGCGQRGSDWNSQGLKLFTTDYYFLRPNGFSVQGIGITPDLETGAPLSNWKLRESDRVPLSPEPYGHSRFLPFPDIQKIETCVRLYPMDSAEDDLPLMRSAQAAGCLL
jgi:C-terminal processing protease CtpA/Prc